MVVGTGDPRYEDMWRRCSAAAAPHRFGVHIGFDERRAHLVEAGADVFLMPSRYEPCGLNQMYSMRYGTVPDRPRRRRVGRYGASVRSATTGRAPDFCSATTIRGRCLPRCAVRSTPTGSERAWQQLQVNGMTRDFSWERSAAEYVTVYKRVIAARQNQLTGRGSWRRGGPAILAQTADIQGFEV